jgi:hypothetical protein
MDFLDWLASRGITGSADADEFDRLLHLFNEYANIPASPHRQTIVRELKNLGVSTRTIDLKRDDERYWAQRGCGRQRPRIRIYTLPSQDDRIRHW